MTQTTALRMLDRATEELLDALSTVQLTVCDDAPTIGRTMAVDELGDALIELTSEAERLLLRVRAVTEAGAEPAREEVRRAVADLQDGLHAISDRLDAVTAHHLIAELDRLSRRGGGEWRAWWSASARGLADCEPARRAVRDALFACWQELAESGGVRVDQATVGRLHVLERPLGTESLKSSSLPRPSPARVEGAQAGTDVTRGGHR